MLIRLLCNRIKEKYTHKAMWNGCHSYVHAHIRMSNNGNSDR